MRRTACAWPVIASLACNAAEARAQEMQDAAVPARMTFDARLLRGTRHGEVDLSRFERGDAIAPGLHALDVVRNGVPIGRRTIRFVADAPDVAATPCIDRSLAEASDLAITSFSPMQRAALDDPAQCARIASLIPAARADYDAEDLALQLSVPQAALAHVARDAIDPALRDAGIAAFRANYALSGSHQDRASDGDRTQASARIELGANVGKWRWRHRATHAWQSGSRLHSNPLSTTLERDLDAFDAQLTLGDFHTRGVLFDAVGLRGVRIESDDRMLPPSLVRYAPAVRGVANTHARVQVRQGHVLLYDTTVAPGPFALRDVQPLGLGGALDVRVVEADGQVTTFSIPYTAIPGLLRPGHARFSMVGGRWRGAHGRDAHHATDLVFQGTVQRGVHDRLTVHAGAQLAPDFAQALGGFAFSTRAGALSIDRAQSWMARDAGTLAGHALRLAYAGRVPATGTTVDVAAWRHGSNGFRSLSETMRRPSTIGDALREHTRTDASLRQAFRSRGTLTLGLVDRTWRNSPARQRSLRVGWGIPMARNGLLQATFDHAIAGTQRTTTGTLSLSLPLAIGTAPGALHAHARVVDDQATMHASAAGAFGRDRRHAWGGGLSHATQDGEATTTANATLSTQGRAGRASGGISASQQARQWSATSEGSVLVHAQGTTFGMPLGETVALVHAPHGRGAALLHHPAVRLDRAGRGVVPHLSPYRRNTVGVEPRGLSPDVQFDWTERSVVPRAGAVLNVALPTTHAPMHRLRIVRANGQPAPFAADVRDLHGVSLGTVGRDGVVLLRAPVDATRFELHWRETGEALHCHIALPSPTAPASNARPHPIHAPCTE